MPNTAEDSRRNSLCKTLSFSHGIKRILCRICFIVLLYEIERGVVVRRSIFSRIITKTPHCSPGEVWVSFMSVNSDMCSDLVPVVLYDISYHAGPCSNGTALYDARNICICIRYVGQNVFLIVLERKSRMVKHTQKYTK